MTQPICETAGAVIVGVVAAAVLGVAPAPAAAMALLASLATRVAANALNKLPKLEDTEATLEKFGTILVVAAWCASITQVSQIFLRYAGYSVPFAPGIVIATASSIIGGKWLYDVVNRAEVID